MSRLQVFLALFVLSTLDDIKLPVSKQLGEVFLSFHLGSELQRLGWPTVLGLPHFIITQICDALKSQEFTSEEG
jgi:hypothetical protein